MALSDDEVFRQWRGFCHQVETTLKQAETDPAIALEYGIAAQPLGRRDTEERIKRLRTVAQKLIPAEFEWEVQATIGGGCYLLFKGYKDATPS